MTLKFMYGNAFRAPNVYERLYSSPDDKPNPFLKPEEIRTLELALEQQIGPHVRTTIDVFGSRVSNLIDYTLDEQDGLNQFQNVDSASAAGAELEIEGHWRGGARARVSTSWQRTRDKVLDEPLTNSPRTLTQAMVSWPLPWGRSQLSADLRIVGTRTSWSGVDSPRHAVLNVSLVRPAVKHGADLRVTLMNVFDRRYSDPGTEDFRQALIPQDGRRVFAGFGYSF